MNSLSHVCYKYFRIIIVILGQLFCGLTIQNNDPINVHSSKRRGTTDLLCMCS